MRASFIAFITVALVAAATGHVSAQCPAEPGLLNYDGAGTVGCPCFVVGEQAGAVFQAPAGDYPIEILKVRIGWASTFGGAPQSLEQAVHIYAGGLPNPGAPIFSLLGPVLTDGFINEFDIEFVPGNKIINNGPFTVTLEFANQNAGDPFAPSVYHDGNGCQPGQNVVFAIPGGWNDACLLGVTGDWVFEVIYRRVNCGLIPCAVNCPQGDADGVVGTQNRSVDIDGNGNVGVGDLAAFALAFAPNPYDACSDFNCDGFVVLQDLAVFAMHWLHSGGGPSVCN